VRLDVIQCFTALLQMCDKVASSSDSLLEIIISKVPAIMKAAKKQLQGILVLTRLLTHSLTHSFLLTHSLTH
jgi:hypothetical protein